MRMRASSICLDSSDALQITATCLPLYWIQHVVMDSNYYLIQQPVQTKQQQGAAMAHKETRTMATLVYWKATADTGYDVDSVRAPTRKALLALVANDTGFSAPRKITITYTNAFDLMEQCKTNTD